MRWRAHGQTREEVVLQKTPMGDFLLGYLESPDPVAANREFATSNDAFDRWFKDGLKPFFPPFINFDATHPLNEQIWDWAA